MLGRINGEKNEKPENDLNWQLVQIGNVALGAFFAVETATKRRLVAPTISISDSVANRTVCPPPPNLQLNWCN